MDINLTNNDDIDKIKKNLQNEDFLVRCDAVHDLSKYNDDPYVLNILIEMLGDKNYLVRCDVCDALYNTKSKKVLESLVLKLKKEKSSTARMYMVSTICGIIKNIGCSSTIKIELMSLYEKEKSKCVIIAYMSVFYLMDKNKKFIKDALCYINDKNYHIRSNVINLLNDVVDEKIFDTIIHSYKRRLEKEDVFCVKELLERSLIELSSK